METKKIVKEVERLSSLLQSYTGNTFGRIKIVRSKRLRAKTIIPLGRYGGNDLEWEPEEPGDFKPLFQIGHEMETLLFQDPLIFSIGKEEVWISTWYFGTGKPEKDILCHPFVMSWIKFLETNKIPQTVGLDGSCNAEFFSLKQGLQILELWIGWVLKYS